MPITVEELMKRKEKEEGDVWILNSAKAADIFNNVFDTIDFDTIVKERFSKNPIRKLKFLLKRRKYERGENPWQKKN